MPPKDLGRFFRSLRYGLMDESIYLTAPPTVTLTTEHSLRDSLAVS